MKSAAHRTMATLALLAGALAAAVSHPQPPLAGDEIDAVDLAQRLRAAPSDLIVLDARTSTDTDRLPGSQPLAAIDATAIANGTLVVIYAEQALDRARIEAWRGNAPVVYRRLRGGFRAWNDEVLFPSVRSDASAREQRAFVARAALSRYFGGSPRRVDPSEVVARPRGRRGC